jgi:tetratricopeptide (TPR) repeat protein
MRLKKGLCGLLIGMVVLYAGNLTAADSPDGISIGKTVKPAHEDAALLKAGMRYYKRGDYAKAYEIFRKLELTHLSELDFQVILGRSAYETGHYEDAVIAFERVVIARPDDTLAKLEMARSYYALGNYTDAEELFKEILKSQIPSSVRQKVLIYLSKIEHNRTRNYFHGSIMIGIGYDSNVYNRARYDEIFLPAYQIKVDNAVIDDDDFYHQELVQLHHLYDFGEQGGFAMKNDGGIYFQTMQKHSDKNLFYANYTPALVYLHKNYLINFAFGFDKMFYGSDPYLHTYYFMPSFQYISSYERFYKLTLTFQRKKSDSPLNEGRDANYLMATALMHTLLSDTWILEPSFSLIRERKIDSHLTNVDHDAGLFRLWSGYRISPDKSVSVDLIVKKLHYTDSDHFFLKKRDDIYTNVSATFAKKFANDFRVETVLGYIDNHSNLDTYKYNKMYANINLIKEF